MQWRRWCLHPQYALGDGEETRAQFAAQFERALWSTYLIPELS